MLYLASNEDIAGDTAYYYDFTTDSHDEMVYVPYTHNSAAAWKKATDTVTVTKAKLEFTDHDGAVRGTAEVRGDIKAGTEINVPVTYRYITRTWDSAVQAQRETVMEEQLTVNYTVLGDLADGFCLRFNKLANAPAYEAADAVRYGSSDGVPAGAAAYINDMMSDVRLTLWVRYASEGFEFYKTDMHGTPLTGVGFELLTCSAAHTSAAQHSEVADNTPGNCWDAAHPFAQATSAADGLVSFADLTTGDYMLVETSTLPGYQLPQGQWLLEVDNAAGTIDISARGETPPAFKVDEEPGPGGTTVTTLSLPNYPVTELTLTGGPGLYWLGAAAGGLLGIDALLYCVGRKRRRKGGAYVGRHYSG